MSSRTAVTSHNAYPTLSTRRFRFRPFALTDIGQLAALAGEHRIADTSIGIPHPYTMEFARMWISSHSDAWQGRRALHWAALRSGDAVEWSTALVDFALTALNLNRIYALQLGRHPLAGRVLAAIGMQHEGLIRKRIYKGGLVEDVVCWAIARK